MLFVKVVNGEAQGFPKTVRRIIKENPHISFPSVITTRTMVDLGYEPVPFNSADYANIPGNSRIVLIPPTKVNGVWRRNYHVRPYTQLEINRRLNNLRIKRDALLKETDWTTLADVRKNKSEAWITAWENYRQQLRDITNAEDIFRVRFPTKPTINE